MSQIERQGATDKMQHSERFMSNESKEKVVEIADQLIRGLPDAQRERYNTLQRGRRRKRVTIEELPMTLAFSLIVLVMAFVSREEQGYHQNKSVDDLLALRTTRDGKERKVCKACIAANASRNW